MARVKNKNTGIFSEKVARVVASIPRGKVSTYKEVAARAGNPGAYRAVGNFLNSYDVKIWGKLPCHRVIKSDGSPGGYRWGVKNKLRILKEESAEAIKNKNTA